MIAADFFLGPEQDPEMTGSLPQVSPIQRRHPYKFLKGRHQLEILLRDEHILNTNFKVAVLGRYLELSERPRYRNVPI